MSPIQKVVVFTPIVFSCNSFFSFMRHSRLYEIETGFIFRVCIWSWNAYSTSITVSLTWHPTTNQPSPVMKIKSRAIHRPNLSHLNAQTLADIYSIIILKVSIFFTY